VPCRLRHIRNHQIMLSSVRTWSHAPVSFYRANSLQGEKPKEPLE
jgi:hypothetical protein